MLKYKIADMIVGMNPTYEPLRSQCVAYLCEKDFLENEIDCIIPQGNKVIEKFRKKHPHLSLGECEYLLYGTYFYHALLDKNGFMMHASAVCYQNEGYLFSAPSGTGKSTHTSNWLKIFDNADIINDDKPAIKIVGDDIYVYGTPFSGKTSQNVNKRCLLKGISFLERSEENSIEAMSIAKAVSLIFYHTIRPYDEKRLDQLKMLIEKVVMQVPMFTLKCNMDLDAVKVAYNGMKQNKKS